MVRLPGRFNDRPVLEVFEMAKIGQDIINAAFKHMPPLKIELEKGFLGFIQRGRKRYAGRKYLLDPKKELGYVVSLHVSGVESVRRDNAPVVGSTVKRIIELLLEDRNPQAARDYVRDVVRKLRRRELAMDQLTITQGIAKEHYKDKQPHVEVNKKIIARAKGDVNAGYRVGERVPYVVCNITTGKNYKVSENAEDPQFAEKNDIPINVEYYLQKMEKPVRKIMDKVFDPEGKIQSMDVLEARSSRQQTWTGFVTKQPSSTESKIRPKPRSGFSKRHLFSGDHTRIIKMPSVANRRGNPFAAFVVQRSVGR